VNLEKEIETLKARYRDLESRVQETENYKNPLSTEGRLISTMQMLEDMLNQMSTLQNKIKSFEKDEKFVEVFTDVDIKDLYTNSGLSTNIVKAWLEKNFNDGKDLTMATVSNYLNGNVKDMLARSMLGRYLRYECMQKNKNIKN
jgi:hypothetical protein